MVSKLLSSGLISGIRKFQYPACVNCVYFIKTTNNENYGRCKKFGEMDLVTGVIEHDFAKLCREDTKKCGWRGSEYQKS